MKTLLALMIALGALSAHADHHEEKATPENFAKMKAEALSNIDKRLSALTEHKTCVNAATGMEQMRACREKMQTTNMEFRDEHMGKRMEHMQKRREKLKQRQQEKAKN